MDKTIEYVLEVARCGGIAKAARNLFITPSALSKYIILKEEELGVRIFNREGNKFTLTYPGERYIEMLTELQEARRKMSLEMNRLADMYSGRLHVGFQMSLAELVVKQIVPAMQDQFPSIRISLEEGGAGELRKMLKTNQLDVVLTLADEADEEKDLRCEHIFASPVVIATAKGSPVRRNAVPKEGFSHLWLPDETILKEKLILDKGERNFRKYAGYLFEHEADVLRSEIMVTNAKTALLCVAEDMGIIVLPEFLVTALHYENDVELYSYGKAEQCSYLSVVYDAKSALVHEISEFLRMVGECFQNINQ